MMMERHSVRTAPSAATDHESYHSSASSSIPIPRSHIRRTPSEARLEEESLRAEQRDVRMFARIVAGLQLQYSNCKNQSIAHRSHKSLQDIVKTKRASQEELAQRDGRHNDEWEVSFIEDRDDNEAFLLWPTQAQPHLSKILSDASMSTMSTQGFIKNEDENDDDCVFSMEL